MPVAVQTTMSDIACCDDKFVDYLMGRANAPCRLKLDPVAVSRHNLSGILRKRLLKPVREGRRKTVCLT